MSSVGEANFADCKGNKHKDPVCLESELALEPGRIIVVLIGEAQGGVRNGASSRTRTLRKRNHLLG